MEKDTTDYIKLYHEEVAKGNIVVSNKMHQQIERVKRMLDNDKYEYRVDLANKPINFAKMFCQHYEGPFAGKEVDFELWQKYFIAVSHGLVYKDTQLRITRQVMVMVGRKNGKSTTISALSLYHLMADGENAPQVYSIANKLAQARIIYEQCYKMASKNSLLADRLKKRRTDIEFPAKDGILSPLASDSNKLDGLNPSFSAFDEVHAFKEQNLISVIQSGLGAREQPLMFMISTNGNTRGKVFDNRYDYFSKVLTGEIEDDTVQPFLYELDSIDELEQSDMWIKANPNIGISLSEKYIIEQIKVAKDDPIQANEILMKHFNFAVNDSTVFFTEEECKENVFDDSMLRESSGFLGIDMSYTNDFTAITYITSDFEKVYTKTWLLKPQDLLREHALRDKVDYEYYNEIGEIVTLPGSRIGQLDVINFLIEIIEEYDLSILKVGVDPYHAEVILDYMRENYYNEFAVAVHNGYFKAVTPTIYTLKYLLRDRELMFNEKMLSIMLASCKVEERKDETITLVKLKQNMRIDGVWSMIYSLKARELYDKDLGGNYGNFGEREELNKEHGQSQWSFGS